MRFFNIAVLILACSLANAQTTNDISWPWNIPSAPLRTEFISYDIRETAEKGDLAANKYYLRLNPAAQHRNGSEILSMQLDVPYMWLDREVFLRVEGIAGFSVSVNGRSVGYGGDSRVPTEFNISPFITDGMNSVEIQPVKAAGERLESDRNQTKPNVYIFSQPKIRIEDYSIRFEPDSTGTHGIFDLEIVMANSYNADENISVGFDVYSPRKLEHFDIRPFTIRGGGRDTIRISERIWRTPEHKWSASSPWLYRGMLIVRKGNRYIEYVPYKTGFGTTEYKDGKIYRNGHEITIKAARYNHSEDRKTTGGELAALKKQGINTICTDYPQPMWFYELCDATGLYVIDQANINNGPEYGVTDPAGSLANDPDWLATFMSRVESMYKRARNHTCVIGWSTGGEVGNGFNMYRCYLWLKDADQSRAVVFNGAGGQWNSDMEPIKAVDAKELLRNADKKTPPKRK